MPEQPPPLDAHDENDNASTTLGWALHHLAVATAALDTVLARQLGLSSTDYLAMKHLVSADEPLGPVDLARLLGMSTGSATALIDRLQSAGHVERRPHAGDRRRLIIVPTNSSTEAIAIALSPLSTDVNHLQEQFIPPEIAAIHRFLSAATKIHDEYRPPVV